MKPLKKMGPLLTTAAMMLVLFGQVSPAMAELDPAPRLISAPVEATETVNADGTLTVKGVLEYSELEGGFYTLNGWGLIGDVTILANHVGKEVEVTGTKFDGMSIRMVKQLTVTDLKASDVAANESAKPMIIEGAVEYVMVETPHYAVAGWALRGDNALFESLVGQQVIVRGTEFTGMSTQIQQQVDVEYVARPLNADLGLPRHITVNGAGVRFDQGPTTTDGNLLLPLRFIVEAAGGKVEWNEQERSVLVTLSDRTAWFQIGAKEAEMNMNGYRYLRRNMLPLSHPAIIQGDRTMIPADAVTQILGLVERVDSDRTMDLLTLK